MKSLWSIVLLLAACTAQAQTIRAIPVQVNADELFPKSIKFFCTPSYDRQHCTSDVISLKLVLQRYPLSELGPWSFVLASSGEWKELLRSLGGIVGSPAFSVLGNRVTVLEEALFSASESRRAELIRMFGMEKEPLLRVAVAHELIHALCGGELSENRVAAKARDLVEGQFTACRDTKQNPSFSARAHWE